MINQLRHFLIALGKLLLSSTLTALVVVVVFLFAQSLPANYFSPNVPVTPTSQQGTTTVITSTLTYDSALRTYENVATTAIQASERSLDVMKWLVGAVFALSTIATSVAAYLYRITRDAAEKAQKAELAARDAQKAAATTEQHLNILSQQYTKLADRYFEISRNTWISGAGLLRLMQQFSSGNTGKSRETKSLKLNNGIHGTSGRGKEIRRDGLNYMR